MAQPWSYLDRKEIMSKSSTVLAPPLSSTVPLAPSLKPVTAKPAVQPPLDLEAEWTQRMLQGLKRMDEDPEFRAAVEKRLS